MVAAAPLPQPPPPPVRPLDEQRVLLSGVSWDTYVALREADDRPGLRMTYCRGALEIMSPGPEHEEAKTIIARLVEMFAVERDVPLLGYGSTTLRKAVTLHGLEPDECYCVGHRLTSVPDLAIEVVITSGGIEKLPVYQGLGVQEVWFWEDEAFHLFALRDAREEGGAREYEPIAASEILPAIDLGVIAALVRGRDQLEAVRAYRAWLRG